MIRATSIDHIDCPPADTVTLCYDDRYRRRIVMRADGGLQFLLDLPQAKELRGGDDLMLEDGRHIRVRAADEALMRAAAKDGTHLTRAAWHVGNRHLPCEIHEASLVLRWDHVIADMLEQQGCKVERFEGPFNPEGGAYGHGRTHTHGLDHSLDHSYD